VAPAVRLRAVRGRVGLWCGRAREACDCSWAGGECASGSGCGKVPSRAGLLELPVRGVPGSWSRPGAISLQVSLCQGGELQPERERSHHEWWGRSRPSRSSQRREPQLSTSSRPSPLPQALSPHRRGKTVPEQHNQEKCDLHSTVLVVREGERRENEETRLEKQASTL